MPVSLELVQDSYAMPRFDVWFEESLRWAMEVSQWLLVLGETYLPNASLVSEVERLELGEPRLGDQPYRVAHDECWTCDCVGWGRP